MADEHHGLDLAADENSRKSRKGSIPRNVDTFLKKSMVDAFVDEISKLADDQPPTKIKLKHMGQAALFGGAASPALKATGNFAKGFVNHAGGNIAARVGGGLEEVARTTRGDIASKALEGALGGTVVSAASNALANRQREEAARTKQSDLFGGAGGAPSGPKISTPAAPTLGVLRGSSNKSQRVGNTPIAAKSGVTRSMSGTALNPRANLGDAMKPKV